MSALAGPYFFDECPSRDDWVSVASLGIVG